LMVALLLGAVQSVLPNKKYSAFFDRGERTCQNSGWHTQG
jgi:hypothetical protein